jgi:OmpW family
MRNFLVSLALALGSAICAPAQLVSVGVLGGVRLTDGFRFNDESRIYDVGPSVEVRLPAGFAVEADALYQRVGYSQAFINFVQTSPGVYQSQGVYEYRERGNQWEFPLLGKYYFRPRSESWNPFVGIGPSFRTGGFHADFGPPSGGHSDFILGAETGAAVAAGLRLKVGPIALAPQARYTYWGAYASGQGLGKNEVTLLLGVSF